MPLRAGCAWREALAQPGIYRPLRFKKDNKTETEIAKITCAQTRNGHPLRLQPQKPTPENTEN